MFSSHTQDTWKSLRVRSKATRKVQHSRFTREPLGNRLRFTREPLGNHSGVKRQASRKHIPAHRMTRTAAQKSSNGHSRVEALTQLQGERQPKTQRKASLPLRVSWKVAQAPLERFWNRSKSTYCTRIRNFNGKRPRSHAGVQMALGSREGRSNIGRFDINEAFGNRSALDA